MTSHAGRRRCRLFVLPGGDSPWPISRSDLAAIPDALSWSRMGTAMPTVPRIGTGAARRLRPGAGCTRPTNGPRTCSLRSSCRSLSAGRAPKGGSGCGPRMWTTSSPIAETGASSQTGQICRACAIAATAGKRPWNCGKTGGKAGGDEHAALPDAWAHGRAQAPAQVRGQDSFRPCPPGVKKFAPPGARPHAPLHTRNFPHGRGKGPRQATDHLCPGWTQERRRQDAGKETAHAGAGGQWPQASD